MHYYFFSLKLSLNSYQSKNRLHLLPVITVLQKDSKNIVPGQEYYKYPHWTKNSKTACDDATGWFCQVHTEFDTEDEVDECDRANRPFKKTTTKKKLKEFQQKKLPRKCKPTQNSLHASTLELWKI